MGTNLYDGMFHRVDLQDRRRNLSSLASPFLMMVLFSPCFVEGLCEDWGREGVLEDGEVLFLE